jgi:hypothetical protein
MQLVGKCVRQVLPCPQCDEAVKRERERERANNRWKWSGDWDERRVEKWRMRAKKKRRRREEEEEKKSGPIG